MSCKDCIHYELCKEAIVKTKLNSEDCKYAKKKLKLQSLFSQSCSSYRDGCGDSEFHYGISFNNVWIGYVQFERKELYEINKILKEHIDCE